MRIHSLALAIVLSCAPCVGADSVSGDRAIRVPFVTGLSTVRAVSTPEGDYEVLRVVDSIDNTAYRVTVSGEAPADDGGDPVEIDVSRTVRAVDQSSARKMRNYFHDGDPETFPGTVPGVSASVIENLRKHGTAELTVLDVGQVFGVSTVRRTLSGVIARVAGSPASLPMLVNGHLLPLPVIHAKGRLSQGNQAEEYELYLLDDPANPIVLRLQGAGSSSAIIKIEYPEPRNSRRRWRGRSRPAKSPACMASIFRSPEPTSASNRSRCLQRSPRFSKPTRNGSCESTDTPMASATMPPIWICRSAGPPR